jgi:hypothetical protein
VLEDTSTGTFQRGHMEGHPYFTYVMHLERKKSTSFQRLQVKCAYLKSSFLSALLDWAVTFILNFSSSNLVDFVNFLDF